MLRKLGEKLGVVNHIRGLFAGRGETFRAASWNCVLRDGRLVVVRSFLKQPSDVLIMDAVLDSDRLPSWYATYTAVTRNWSVIARAEAAA